MSVIRNNIVLFIILMTSPVTAAEVITNERSLSGNLAVWIFLGLCALIIVAQVVPMLWQMNKQSRQITSKTEVSDQPQAH